MKPNSRLLALFLCVVTALAVQAQEGVADTLVLREISVTAIKQASDLRSQATPVTVVDRAEVERNQMLTPKAAAVKVPNLFMPDYGSRMTGTVYVRGIGTRIDQPAMGLTVDNVPVLTKENYDIDLMDISRLEMLRGPQSTLYGRNTMGGVMNVYTLSPFNYQGTRLLGEWASHSSWRVAAAHYARMSERLAISAEVHYGSTRGEYRNQFNGRKCDWERQGGGRLKLEWRPDASLTVSNVLWLGVTRQGGYPYEWTETEHIAYNDTCFYRRTSLLYGLTVRKQFAHFTLSGITSYQYLDDNMTLDQDFTVEPYFTLTQARTEHAVTQDVVARSLPGRGDGYNWLVGAFGFFRRYVMSAPVTFKDVGIARLIEDHVNDAMSDYPVAWDTRSFVLGSHFTSPNWGGSLYHESTYRVGQWTLAAGLRLDYEQATLRYHSETRTGFSVMHEGAVYAHVPIDIDERGTLKRDFLQLLPRLSATWHPWPGKPHTVYAVLSRGAKAGGFNTQMFSDVLQQRLMNMMGIGVKYDVDKIVTYDPEKAWNMEMGGHFECWNSRVRSDLSVFYMDCRDRQLTVFPDGTTTGRVMTNAGRTRNWGVEFAMEVRPLDNTMLNISYGYTNAKFVDYDDGKDDYSGNYVPYSPAHTFYVEALRDISMGHDKSRRLTLAVNLRCAGRIYWNEANSQSQPFYAQLGATATLHWHPVQLQLWATNLTDTHYKAFYFVSIQHEFMQRGRGRMLGVTLRLNFDQ